MTAPITKVPNELRKILLDFTLSCLLEKPSDYVEHGRQYFEKLRDCRARQRRLRYHVEEEMEEEIVADDSMAIVDMRALASRRASVLAERYDPEGDSDSTKSSVVPKTDEERKRLAEAIREVLIFRVLDRNELNNITEVMSSRDVKMGEVIIEQGDPEADHFFVIDAGVFEALVTSDTDEAKVVRTYDNKGSFGELALLYNVPRAATVRAMTDGKLWYLDRGTFKRKVLRSAYLKRERYQGLLEQVKFLRALSSYAKLDLADSLIPRYYEDKAVVFRQGDAPDGMYFIESGGITCLVEHPVRGEVVVTELFEGDYLGELALITHNQRALTAVTSGETKLAFLDKDAFERLLGPCTDLLTQHFSDYEFQMMEAVGSSTSVYYKDKTSLDVISHHLLTSDPND